MDSTVVLLALSVLHSGASLECYKCTAVLDLAVCDMTQRCKNGQVCFLNSTISGEIQVTSLGCTSHQRCGVQNNIQSSTVGGEINTRETSSCFECCSTDKCNKHLCQHLKPSVCADDESVDCAKMNILFSICTETDNAKKVCPRFCGLCNMYVVDGNWSNWSKWSQCDVTCGKGTQTRIRLCNNPAPKNGGNECLGNEMSTKSCFVELCPVDGGWSPWEEWVSCSTSCDIGLQSRKRNCSNPIPERNGKHCFGNNFDVRQCMPGPCANGGWSDWDNSNTCSVTCGLGVRLKTRSCTNPPPSPFGQYCIGDHSQMESCTMPKCDYCQLSPCVNGVCINMAINFLCICPPGVIGSLCETIPASDCYDILRMNPGKRSGIYWIKLWKSRKSLEVFCDLETDKGGWTICSYDEKVSPTRPGAMMVFQLRFNGSLDFHRNFANYTEGFGYVHEEFWLGLQNIYEVASQSQSELRIDLEAADGKKAYEIFQNFSLSPRPDYTLHISKGTGTAGSGTQDLSYNNGKPFSTYDHGTASTCASSIKDSGGWWYEDCTYANLNATDYCLLSPYVKGACINMATNFSCICPPGVIGSLCETSLQNIYEVASQSQSELRIDLEAADGKKAYEIFQNFSLSPRPGYTLHISKGTGTAGSGTQYLSYNNGKTFSTYDYVTASRCASSNMDSGGWWYDYCTYANLNGKYVTPGTINPTYSEGGVTYMKFQRFKSLKRTKMMIRRIN